MFDVRYHALSLAAVFIALVVGLLLGVAIGDKELVAGAREDLRKSLKADLRKTAHERDEAKARLREQDQFADESYPILTANQLSGRRIGLVLLGANDRAPDIVRDAVEPAGAKLAFVAVVRERVELNVLAERAHGTRYADVERDPTLLDDLGKRAGIQMVLGGRLVGELRTALLQSLSGRFGNLDGVVILRSSRAPKDKEAAKRLAELHDGIARGLAQAGVKAVGVERRGSDASDIGWFRERDLSTIDNIDEQAGRAALVFVLAGAEGSYGRRNGAQALLPSVVGRVR